MKLSDAAGAGVDAAAERAASAVVSAAVHAVRDVAFGVGLGAAVQVLEEDVSKALSQVPLFEQTLPLIYVLYVEKLCTSQFVEERVMGMKSPEQASFVKTPKFIVPAEQLCHLANLPVKSPGKAVHPVPLREYLLSFVQPVRVASIETPELTKPALLVPGVVEAVQVLEGDVSKAVSQVPLFEQTLPLTYVL